LFRRGAPRIGGLQRPFSASSGAFEPRSAYPQIVHKQLWTSCEQNSLLVSCNERKSSNGAVFGRVLLATMKAQQAVAIRFVGRRVTLSTCLFFSLSAALRALASTPDASP